MRSSKHLLLDMLRASPLGSAAVVVLCTTGAAFAMVCFLLAGSIFDSTDPVPLAWMFLAAVSARYGSFYAADIITVHVAVKASAQLRARVIRHVLALPVRSLQERGSGELADRIDDDVQLLVEQLGQPMTIVVRALIGSIIAGFVLAFTVWQLAVLALVFSLAVSFMARRTLKKLLEHNMRKEEAQSEAYGVVEEVLAARTDLRANLGQGFVGRLYAERVKKFLDIDVEASKHARDAYVIGNGAAWLSGLVLMGVAIAMVIAGDLTFGSALAGVAAASFLFDQTKQVTEKLSHLQGGLAALERVGLLLAEDTEPSRTSSGVAWDSHVPIEFRDLTFRYAGGHSPAIDALNMRIDGGERVGLVGRTGAGKTTVVKILMKQEEAPAGTVFIGGVDIRDIGHTELRANVGYLSQRQDLIDATLTENISLFDPTLDRQTIEDAIDALELRSWVDGLHDGLDTRLGAGGRGLSTGERQLVAFARLWVRQPAIVILDEATSRLDPETEDLVRRASEHLLAQRTSIVIAHRLATLDFVDTVAVMSEGRLIEHGDRVALEAAGGHWTRMLDVAGTAGNTAPSTPTQQRPAAPDSADVVADSATADEAHAQPSIWRAMFGVLRHRPSLMATAMVMFVTTASMGIAINVISATALEASSSDSERATMLLAVALVITLVEIVIFGSAIRRIIRGWNSVKLVLFGHLLEGQTAAANRDAGDTQASPIEASARAYDCEKLIVALDNTVDAFASIPMVIVTALLLGRPDLMLVLSPIMLFAPAVAWLSRHQIRDRVEIATDARADVGRLLGSVTEAAGTVKMFAAEEHAASAVIALDDVRNVARLRQNLLLKHVEHAAWLPHQFMEALALFAFATGRIGPAVAVALYRIGGHLGWHAFIGAKAVSEVAAAGAWLARYRPLLATGVEVGVHPAHLPAPWERIEPEPTAPVAQREIERLDLRGISVVAPDGATLVASVDMTVTRGQLVVVTGRVGAGKTTLLEVLAGLREATVGEMRINGAVVADPSAVMRPPNVAWVAQLPLVVSGPLGENIALDRDIDLVAATEQSQLVHDLRVLGGTDVHVGNKGVRLSGGQLQRVALARGIAHTEQILVCDDISSALDPATEQAVWSALRDSGLTVVASATRRVALEAADQVIVLDGGNVVATGPWADLERQWGSLAA